MLHFNKLNYKYSEFKTSKKTNEYLEKISKRFDYYCNFFFNLNYVSNNNDYGNNLIINELKKNFIKSIICYDKLSVDFCKNILCDYKENACLAEDNPNLMIHLPDDVMEEGRYHYDQLGADENITIWTPITEYKYTALTYYNVGALIYKLLKLFKIDKLLPEQTIQVKKFRSIKWSGYFIHKGCLNTSNNISSAIIVGLKKSNKNNSNLIYENFTDEIIDHNFKMTLEFINYLNHNPKFKNLETKEKFEYIKKILLNYNFSINKLIIAKILSVVAQRLFTNSRINKNFKDLSHLIDISVYVLDKKNFSSLSRLKKTNFFN